MPPPASDDGGDADFSIEKCLSKSGNPNFVRKGKTLTVLAGKGKKIQYQNNPTDGEEMKIFAYEGYDPASGFHFVRESNYEWGSEHLIDHESGAQVQVGSYLPNSVSPDRQWILSASGDPSDCGGMDILILSKLPLRGRPGKQQDIPLPAKLSECRTGHAAPNAVTWVDATTAKVDWQCTEEGNDTSRPDQTTLTLQGKRWSADRLPCTGGKAAPTSAAPAAARPAAGAATTLRVGMTLPEVEALFGRTADGLKVSPLSLFGKKPITRVWKGNGRQIEVQFESDQVVGWH
ncbi:hypothetical protein [Chitiniphilus eburneus]|uniref:Uncharacterized protein n=1 Tax=Chitiniphilus eburneus TaxID=2571148 RepID=A0A4U0PXD0_9NEIS|nr:hypothetical protein [Chitiniphilus eburneus]TJZ73199.1 hypothetical protein FAZ21_11315 [Chitiniphilus eburneus]